jgi:hypothetical protein
MRSHMEKISKKNPKHKKVFDLVHLQTVIASHELALREAGYSERQLLRIRQRVTAKHVTELGRAWAVQGAYGCRLGGLRGKQKQMRLVARELRLPVPSDKS